MMKLTTEIIKELNEYTGAIYDQFTTKDYIADLNEAYLEHVVNFYEAPKGLFRDIYEFKKAQTTVRTSPCTTPLADISESQKELRHIIGNTRAYRQVISVLMTYCNSSTESRLMRDLLKVLRDSPKKLHAAAERYDTYMGDSFSTARILKAVYAYGKLSGLVDYYNFKELKDVINA